MRALSLITAVAALLAVLATGAQAATRTGCDSRSPPQPIDRVDGVDAPKVAITFDERIGPLTRGILATFDRFGMSGTFYAVGREVRARPAKSRAILGAGHEIGNHSWDHADLTTLTAAQTRENLQRTNRTIRKVTGFQPCTFRPPGGVANATVTRQANSLALLHVNWTRASDPFTDDPIRICANALDDVRRGDIVLLHQIQHSADALPCILRGLRDRGLRSVPVTRLLGGDFTTGGNPRAPPRPVGLRG